MLGSVAFDGFSRTSFWQNRLFRIDTDLGAIAFGLLGLAVGVAIVAAAYVAAVEVARRIGREQARLEQAFIGSLIPIAIAYVVAHYATYLLVQGQLGIPLASDPFGYGWDLFGTLDYRVNVQPLSADQIWYLQAGALILGHVLGLVIAHDKALALFGSTKVALRTQYAMLGVDGAVHGRRPVVALARLIVAHGGTAGLIVEISTAVAIGGLLVWAAIKSRREGH